MMTSEPGFRDNLVVWVIIPLSVLLAVAGLEDPAKTPYFFAARTFFQAVVGLSLAYGILLRLGRTTAAHLAGIVVMALFGYGIMEIAYSRITVRLGLTLADPAWQAFFGNLDTYFLDRSYQYLALTVLAYALFLSFGEGMAFYTRVGDLTVPTTLLGGAEPMPWRRAGGRIAGMIVVLGLANLFLRFPFAADGATVVYFLALVLGGSNNSFIEELLFRGLLLPAFLVRASPGVANWLQAALFSVIHWSYVGDGTWQPVLQEAGKLTLYLGIGWLFGRAAMETRGIGVSTVLHALITAVIWASLTFVPR